MKKKNIQDSVEEKIDVDEKLAEFDTSSNVRKMAGIMGTIITIVAIAMSGFHLWTASFGILLAMKQRAAHLFFVFLLGFLLYPATKKSSRTKIPFYDFIFTGAGMAVTGYILFFL